METRCAKDATTSVHVSLVLCTGITYSCIIYYLFLYSIVTLPMHAVTMFPYVAIVYRLLQCSSMLFQS